MSRFVATLHTSEYRGDHGADVTVVFQVDESETVEQLWRRVSLVQHGSAFADEPADRLVLQVSR